MTNASLRDEGAVSLTCSFVNVTFYRDRQELALNISACVLNVLFAVSSTLSNSVVLLAIWKTRALHTPSNTLLSGLAVTDLAVGCVLQPLYIAMKLLEIHQHLASYCHLRIALETLTMVVSGTSFLILTFIAVERYLALYLHLRYKAIITCQRMAICLAISWLLPVIGALSRFWLSPRAVASIAGSIIIACLLLNIWAYFQIFRFVKRHTTQIENITSCLQASGSTMEISKYNKTVVTMATLLLILIVIFVSFVGVTNAIAFGGKRKRALSTTYTVLAIWIYATSSLNPVFYCWRLRDFRQAVIKIIFNERQWRFMRFSRFSRGLL